jgi:hypothetical protein
MTQSSCYDGDALRTLTAPVRNRYFYGKLLDAYHLELEQNYGSRKRWLLNRTVLGAGVVCGLQLAPTSDGKSLGLGPGVALDLLGREIVVPAASLPFNPRQPTDACGRPAGDSIDGEGVVHLCLAYHECDAEPVPVMAPSCGGGDACAASTVLEGYRVIVKAGPAAAVAPVCDFTDLFKSPAGGGAPNIHPALVARVDEPCPPVEGETCIVLAQVNLPAANDPILADMIDMTVRPIVYSNALLTDLILCAVQAASAGGAPAEPPVVPAVQFAGVKDTSWPHDGALTLAAFVQDGLQVVFQDEIHVTTQRGEAWFLVTVEYPLRIAHGPFPAGTILVQRVLADDISVSGNVASFRPDIAFEQAFRDLADAEGGADLHALCRVVVKCDFLRDSNGHAPDGDRVHDALPSGDGVEGGDYESWFELTL